MDPVTVSAIVSAVVSGAAGEAGGKLWDGLAAIVRRPSRGRQQSAEELAAGGPPTSGAAELAAVGQAPGDEERALELAKVLVARARADAGFAGELEYWLDQARQVTAAVGNVTNTISGGTQHGPVFQGRDFSGITFNSSPPVEPPRDAE